MGRHRFHDGFRLRCLDGAGDGLLCRCTGLCEVADTLDDTSGRLLCHPFLVGPALCHPCAAFFRRLDRGGRALDSQRALHTADELLVVGLHLRLDCRALLILGDVDRVSDLVHLVQQVGLFRRRGAILCSGRRRGLSARRSGRCRFSRSRVRRRLRDGGGFSVGRRAGQRVDARHRAGQRGRYEGRCDGCAQGRRRAFGKEFIQRLVRVEFQPGREILQVGRRLFAKAVRDQLLRERFDELGLLYEVADQQFRRDDLGKALDGAHGHAIAISLSGFGAGTARITIRADARLGRHHRHGKRRVLCGKAGNQRRHHHADVECRVDDALSQRVGRCRKGGAQAGILHRRSQLCFLYGLLRCSRFFGRPERRGTGNLSRVRLGELREVCLALVGHQLPVARQARWVLEEERLRVVPQFLPARPERHHRFTNIAGGARKPSGEGGVRVRLRCDRSALKPAAERLVRCPQLAPEARRRSRSPATFLLDLLGAVGRFGPQVGIVFLRRAVLRRGRRWLHGRIYSGVWRAIRRIVHQRLKALHLFGFSLLLICLVQNAADHQFVPTPSSTSSIFANSSAAASGVMRPCFTASFNAVFPARTDSSLYCPPGAATR